MTIEIGTLAMPGPEENTGALSSFHCYHCLKGWKRTGLQSEEVMFFLMVSYPNRWDVWFVRRNIREIYTYIYIIIYTCVLSKFVVPVVEDVPPKPSSFEEFGLVDDKFVEGRYGQILWFDVFQSIYPPWNKRSTSKVGVGRRSSPFGTAYFQGRTVCFREGIPWKRLGLSFSKMMPPLLSLYLSLSLLWVFSVVFEYVNMHNLCNVVCKSIWG